MTPTADQVNAGAGREICENSAFTTELDVLSKDFGT